MIANPETAAWAGSPRCARPAPSAAAAPPTQKTSPNAAIASAPARRASDGRSGKDGLQWHADDPQPAGEAVERELTQLVFGHAEHRCRVADAVAREPERRRDVGQQLAEHRAHVVGLVRRAANGFPQEPDAVSDVAGLVVMDLRVALHEARQQVVLVEVAGDEAKRRQSERAL